MKVIENGQEVTLKRKLKTRRNSSAENRITIRKLKKKDPRPKSEKLDEYKVFKKCRKRFIKQEKVKPNSLKMKLLDSISESYGGKKYARAISDCKDFHDMTSTNFIIEEKDSGKYKISRSYIRMKRDKIKKLMGESNSGREFVLIQFAEDTRLYRRISISQYLKLTKIARVAIRMDLFTTIDEDYPYSSDSKPDGRDFRRSIKDDAQDLGYDLDTIFSMNTQVFGSVNSLLEWYSRLKDFTDGLILVFQCVCYDYCEDEYSIMVYEKSGKIKYYKNLYEFCNIYGIIG